MDNINWSDPTVIYLLPDPFGKPATKPGITGVRVLNIRTAVHNTPTGLYYEVEYPHCWVAPTRKEATGFEQKLFLDYDDHRPDMRVGMQEWIEKPWQEIKKHGDELIERNGYKIFSMDDDLLPMNHIEEDQIAIKRRYLSDEDFKKWGFIREVPKNVIY